jgi:hypothetical protein
MTETLKRNETEIKDLSDKLLNQIEKFEMEVIEHLHSESDLEKVKAELKRE